MLPARNRRGGRCEVAERFPRLRAVEGNVPICSRVGLTKVGAWTLRACLYACGGLALTFMLGLILTVIFARPASAAQNPIAVPPVVPSATSAVSSVASCLCGLLVCWSALRVWRLSPGHQARHALASGVWQSGIHQYKLRDEGVAWKAPDGSAVFLPWSALTGVRETGRLFLLLDQEGRHVRGFIPKASPGDLPPDAELGDFIRERITAGTSR
jgi:hypothetical protein